MTSAVVAPTPHPVYPANSERALECRIVQAERFMDARVGMNRCVRGVGALRAAMYDAEVRV